MHKMWYGTAKAVNAEHSVLKKASHTDCSNLAMSNFAHTDYQVGPRWKQAKPCGRCSIQKDNVNKIIERMSGVMCRDEWQMKDEIVCCTWLGFYFIKCPFSISLHQPRNFMIKFFLIYPRVIFMKVKFGVFYFYKFNFFLLQFYWINHLDIFNNAIFDENVALL